MDATFTAEEHYLTGRRLLEGPRRSDAFEHFRAAHELDRSSPRYASYYGLGLALVERRFNKAVELCRAAVKEEFFSPDLYRNLARVHLVFGFKAEAIRYLRRGLMIDPGNEEILADLASLGVRRRPVLGFLPRRHFVNRWLGRLRSHTEVDDGAPDGLRQTG